MEIHEKIYVPEYSIQGEDIPLSITWDKSKPITISVSFSENIEIKEIYNIDDSEFEINSNIDCNVPIYSLFKFMNDLEDS